MDFPAITFIPEIIGFHNTVLIIVNKLFFGVHHIGNHTGNQGFDFRAVESAVVSEHFFGGASIAHTVQLVGVVVDLLGKYRHDAQKDGNKKINSFHVIDGFVCNAANDRMCFSFSETSPKSS